MNQPKQYKYYDFIMGGFVTILLCSNIIGVSKVTQINGFVLGAGIFFFPFSYIFGDILTEVYGFARARRVVWTGFAALIFASIMSAFVVAVPPADGWHNQQALETILGGTPRIAMASLVAFFCGEYTNSYVLAKMKILSKGKGLWKRTIGSTLVGEFVDSLIFYPLAFLGSWENSLVLQVLFMNYALKVLIEVVMTPATYKIVAFLKKKENEDFYDYNTDFTPFSAKL